MPQDKNKKIDWPQMVAIFLLGILLASTIFLFIGNRRLETEINKIKADDIALAQAINSLLNQAKTNSVK